MKKSRCVVFGGSGFIGSHLVEELVQNNYYTIALGRNISVLEKQLGCLKNKVDFIKNDFNNTLDSINLLRPGDIVFDLVSSSVPSTSIDQPLQELSNNVQPHLEFYMGACKKKVDKIIFTSSGGGIYGNMGQNKFKETDCPQPQSPHSIGKLTIEYFLKLICKNSHTSSLIYRISNPFGPRQKRLQGFGVVPTLLENIVQGQPPKLFNKGWLIRDFIYIKDLVEAMILPLEKNCQHSIYNIGSGRGLSINEVWNILKEATSSNIEPNYCSKREFDVEKVALDISRFSNEFSWKPKCDVKENLIKLAKSTN